MTTDEKVSIKDQLAAELRDAMKTGDKLRRDAIRQVQTEVTTAAVHRPTLVTTRGEKRP